MTCCTDCNMPYSEMGVDLVLPDQQWKVIFPEQNGLLCANCICKRVDKMNYAPCIMAWVDKIDYSEAAESTRMCKCGVPWEPDCDQFGCWRCGATEQEAAK